jgi:hypothetical protein
MRNLSNEDFVHLRQREMRQTGEERRLGNATVLARRGPRKPFYSPILAYIGVVLSRLGKALQERYAHAPDVPTIAIPETVRE